MALFNCEYNKKLQNLSAKFSKLFSDIFNTVFQFNNPIFLGRKKTEGWNAEKMSQV